MLKKIIVLLFLCVSSATASASIFDDKARAMQVGVGMGLQYGGLLGAQFALTTARDKYFLALGIPTIMVGYQQIVGDGNQHTLGGVAGGIFSSDSDNNLDVDWAIAGSYNYYFNGFSSPGLVLGVDAGLTPIENEVDMLFNINVGYHF